MHIYDPTYYAYINRGALRSAAAVLPVVANQFPVTSVVDFGAGQCAWLSAWRRMGVDDVLGVDGAYVDQSALLIPAAHFATHDLARPVRLGRRFDLVQSLEVAEHLPAQAAETFIDNLVAHGDVVLFSAAAPGQGGEYHVNEQPYDYWRRLFAARGYVATDVVRPEIARDPTVEPWYRYNTFVFVHERKLGELKDTIGHATIPEASPLLDVSPFWYRARKQIIRRLPVWASTALAVVKKHYHVRVHSRDAVAP